jgi:hypothetical protein
VSSLRTLGKAQLDSFLDVISHSRPSLQADLRPLSDLLSYFVEHGRLPPYKLRLESLSRDQLGSMRSTKWSLEELLERCGSREGEDPTVVALPRDHCQEHDGSVTSSPPDLAVPTQPTSQSLASPSSLYTHLNSDFEALSENDAIYENDLFVPATDNTFLTSPLVHLPYWSLAYVPVSS